jgi:hypothetical protein
LTGLPIPAKFRRDLLGATIMQFRTRTFTLVGLCIAMSFAMAETHAAESAVGGKLGNNSTSATAGAATETKPNKCVQRCESDNGRCNSGVRQNRQECSKQAANGGNNPFTGRPDQYDYYCGYFNFDRCAAYGGNTGACAGRFERRYAECVEWMRGNVASRRFDCIKAEGKAQNLCRAELADCKKQCTP